MHAAEHDEFALGPGCGLLGQFEGITGDVGERDHLVALVVVSEDEGPVPECGLGRLRPCDQIRIAGRGQVTGAVHAALAVRVAALAEQQQQRGGLGFGEGVGHVPYGGTHRPSLATGVCAGRTPPSPGRSPLERFCGSMEYDRAATG